MTKKTSTEFERPASKRTVRHFTPEYRAQVIALIRQEHRGVTSVSRELGISSSLIYGWLQKSEAPKSSEKGKDSALLPSQTTVLPAEYVSEMARLRKENEQLKEERDILKKSLGIFASTSR